jgi:hypothetical protein
VPAENLDCKKLIGLYSRLEPTNLIHQKCAGWPNYQKPESKPKCDLKVRPDEVGSVWPLNEELAHPDNKPVEIILAQSRGRPEESFKAHPSLEAKPI